MGGFVSDRVLEEIRFRNDIVEVIQGYVPLKRTGATYKACCPFHKEKTPSFNVNPNMQIFKCFGCGEGGDVISFVMKHQGLDFMAAVRLLAERAGVTIETDGNSSEAEHRKRLLAIHEGLAGFYRRCLLEYAGGAKAREYVHSRGLDEKTGEAFGIGYAPSGWSRALRWGEKHGYREEDMVEAGVALVHREKGTCYDRFRDRLMFPIRDVQGRVIGFSGRLLEQDAQQAKYVNSPETALFSKGRVLYGLDSARRAILGSEGREAIVVEGQIDVIRCHQYGFQTAVAAQGTAFTDEHVALLKRYADSAVLVYDSDGAGQAAALKTAHALMRAGIVVRVALLTAGDDPDSYLLREGPESFAVLLEGAVTTVAFQIGAMRAGSTDADGIRVTTRAAKAVLETIACTPDAVQRSYLLHEAAGLLALSEAALETDLAKLEKMQRDVRVRQSGHGSADTPVEVAKPEPGGSGSGSKKAAGLPGAERSFLLGVVHGGAGVWQLMSGYLVPVLFSHPYCRALFEAYQWADAQNVDVDAVQAPAGCEEQYEHAMRLLERLRREVPIVIAGDEQVMFLQQITLRIWKAYLDLELRRLKQQAGYPDDTAIFARCSQIGHDLDSLRRWDSGQDVIATELSMMDATAAGNC
ncbi:MAG: DNA primase [Kiritimatiellia bacterium]